MISQQPGMRRPSMADLASGKKSLQDVLGVQVDQQQKLRQIQQKYQGYQPPVQRNNGMRGSKGEVFL